MATTVVDVAPIPQYHAREYAQCFSRLEDLLDWLPVCGFLTVRRIEEITYHVVFSTEETKWSTTRFIPKSTSDLPFDLKIEVGVSKVRIIEIHDGRTTKRRRADDESAIDESTRRDGRARSRSHGFIHPLSPVSTTLFDR